MTRLLTIAGLAAVTGSLVGCGSSTHGVTRVGFQTPRVSFSYPSAWKRTDCPVQPELSPQTITVLAAVKSLSSTVCEEEVWGSPSRLGANGLIIEWTLGDFGKPVDIKRFSGKPIRVGGRNARLTVLPGALDRRMLDCGRVGGQKDLLVLVPGDGHHILSVEACLRGPALARGEAAFRKMLASASFAG